MVQAIYYVKLLLIHKIRYFLSKLTVSADSFEKNEFFQPGVVQQTHSADLLVDMTGRVVVEPRRISLQSRARLLLRRDEEV